MMSRDFQRAGLRTSLVLHGLAVLLMLVLPWLLRACDRKRPNEKLMFVEFTVSIPPPPAPDGPAPTPEPPKPEPTDDVPMPDQKVEKKPDPPKDIRQTNRVVRKEFPPAPPPKDKPPSAAEIARLLKMGARISDTTSIPDEGQLSLGAYFNTVRERLYAVWQQPSQLASLPGLSADVRITVEPGGRITGRTKTRSSGNALMDDSVMKAVNSVTALPPLPVGHRRPVDISITFEISD